MSAIEERPSKSSLEIYQRPTTVLLIETEANVVPDLFLRLLESSFTVYGYTFESKFSNTTINMDSSILVFKIY